jgi:MFS superfamily sulfate permease-like transporter
MWDAAAIVMVTVVTLFTNLAIGIGCGITWSLLAFAVSQSRALTTTLVGPCSQSGHVAATCSSGDIEAPIPGVEGGAETATASGTAPPDRVHALPTVRHLHIRGPLFFGTVGQFLHEAPPAANAQ